MGASLKYAYIRWDVLEARVVVDPTVAIGFKFMFSLIKKQLLKSVGINSIALSIKDEEIPRRSLALWVD